MEILDLDKVREQVESWAREAGRIHLRYFRSNDLRIDTKYNSYDVVTRADKESEALIIGKIRESYPGHSILAEESGEHDQPGHWRWVIDPLDGTTNYSSGLPIFCVSIALERDSESVVGVVYAPYLDEMYSAVKGKGATLNGRSISCSKKTSLAESVVSTGVPVNRKDNPDNNVASMARVCLEVRGLRLLGSAAMDLCHTAAGYLDAYWELALHRWDVAAGSLIASEAGARVEYYRPDRPYSIVAAPGPLFAPLLSLIEPE